MNKDEKELKRMLEEVSREIEDKAWAEKKAIYGDKFNAPKFYELERFWPNFIWFIVIFGSFFFITFTYVKKELKEADDRIKHSRTV